MQYYLVPITNQSINQQTVFAPKYYSTALIGLSWTNMPCGSILLGVVMVENDNPGLDGELDVYAFPAGLDGFMAKSDVTNLTAYLIGYNIVLSGLAVGDTFNTAIQTLALNFLTAQANTNTPQVANQIIASLPQIGSINLGSINLNATAVSAGVRADLTG
jgi:hypothetical protein